MSGQKKKRDWSLIQALKVPRIFVPPPRLQPAITEVCADQTDNQSGAQSMHKISTERQREGKGEAERGKEKERDDVLPMPPVAAEQ